MCVLDQVCNSNLSRVWSFLGLDDLPLTHPPKPMKRGKDVNADTFEAFVGAVMTEQVCQVILEATASVNGRDLPQLIFQVLVSPDMCHRVWTVPNTLLRGQFCHSSELVER